jgi:cytochrome oxidase Cu insertion factor (SCO1/SenC/PrrC family)
MKQHLSAALGAAAVFCLASAASAQLAVGTAAPEFSLRDANGQTVRLSQFRGRRYVLLDFWASW